MVALRRFFHSDKSSQTPASGVQDQTQSPLSRDSSTAASPVLSENEHFQNIERQFEVLHDQLKARPGPSSTQVPHSRASSRLTSRNSRHVDLLEALFSSHRYQVQGPHAMSTLSPTSPYNEDIAERNMVPFLRPRNGRKKAAYGRIISALYQEDVADRNMEKNTIFPSTAQSRMKTSQSYQLDCQRHSDGARGRSRSRSKDSQLINSISQEALYSVPKSVRDQAAAESDELILNDGPLRTQRSAPTLADFTPTSEGSVSTHLGVPPAHKQGDNWTHRPLPDSPTLPTATSFDRGSIENRGQQESSDAPAPSPRLSNPGRRPSMAPRAGSKKNILDLSINTELAAKGRPKKISHKAISPPTPNTLEGKRNSSIAEIMNSPLPVLTSTPSPLPSSNKKVAEIMDMFRKAYTSTQEFTPHPTFESLQDAIIREINSHEAFQQLPLPEQGPPFTPSSSEDSYESATPPKPIALKEGQRRRRKSSFKNLRRPSETRKSISTCDPFDAPRQDLDIPNRRRHTDAPPPLPGFFDSLIPQHATATEDAVTYMDLLIRSENSDPKQKRKTNMSGGSSSGPSSLGTPSVLHMRAQTGSPNGSPHRYSNSDSDSDSDVIHLPNIPKVRIHGVDDNNVAYTVENTTPRNAHRLINWPRKSSRSHSLRGTFAKGRTTSDLSVTSY
ncbi:hypothetical protein BDV18DRAFT_135774 [Aspergillus unguis]